MLRSVIRTLGMTNWKHFSISAFYCPLCDRKRCFVRLDADEISIRCLSCKATPITLSLAAVLRHVCPILDAMNVYELSSRGPLFEYLTRKSKKLTHSEYFTDIPPGAYKEGIQCQDVQRLTYPDESFDICTSTEVFEHVPNDAKGFTEICRVLKSNGVFVFTVPLSIEQQTVDRARVIPGGDIEHYLPPEYHSDPMRRHQPILAFRNYGYDILDRLLAAGFKRAELRSPGCAMAWDCTRPVVVAFRENTFDIQRNNDPLLLRYTE